MFAVVRTGGKQHRVTKGDRLKVEKLDGEVGAEVSLDDVLMVGADGQPKVGRPKVDGAKVTAKVIAQGRGPKVLAFKRTRRKGYHKNIGHRQPYTELEIVGIEG